MSRPNNAGKRATVRTYRHGLGDCHLVTLYGAAGAAYRIMIDCGVILGTPDPNTEMTKVMDDIGRQNDNKIDLLVATHEHWDHLSGFVQAKASFDQLQPAEVWMAWTEDPNDKDATALAQSKNTALAMLRGAATRMHIESPGEPSLLSSLLEFFGAAGGVTTKQALEAVRVKCPNNIRYCDPANAPTELPAFDARIYVLGPPRDVKLLKKTLPSKTAPETYSLAQQAFEATVAKALSPSSDDSEQPFSSPHRIPMEVSKSTSFFQQRYWDDESWRRIDLAWMGAADQFALALDNMINNTSLVLAIELIGMGVLLFAADAQVGNWISWADCKWQVAGQEVTGPDLLKRTLFYKVGHHGSFNATLRAQGLDLMDALSYAIIPVDHEMAGKKRWGNIPLPALEAALVAATADRGYVLRTDEDPSELAVSRGARSTALFFEVDI